MLGGSVSVTKCASEESCRHVDALYKSTSLPFYLYLFIDDKQLLVFSLLLDLHDKFVTFILQIDHISVSQYTF